MATQSISMSDYVKKGVNIEALYDDPVNDGEKKWFIGVITKVHKHGKDDCGKYVECDVLYDDDEKVENWRFYDDEYGDDNWRFSSHLTPLVQSLIDRVNALGSLMEDPDADEDNHESETDAHEDLEDGEGDEEISDDEDGEDAVEAFEDALDEIGCRLDDVEWEVYKLKKSRLRTVKTLTDVVFNLVATAAVSVYMTAVVGKFFLCPRGHRVFC